MSTDHQRLASKLSHTKILKLLALLILLFNIIVIWLLYYLIISHFRDCQLARHWLMFHNIRISLARVITWLCDHVTTLTCKRSDRFWWCTCSTDYSSIQTCNYLGAKSSIVVNCATVLLFPLFIGNSYFIIDCLWADEYVATRR